VRDILTDGAQPVANSGGEIGIGGPAEVDREPHVQQGDLCASAHPAAAGRHRCVDRARVTNQLPIAVDGPVVITRAVSIVVADAGAYDRCVIRRLVVRICPVIRRRIVRGRIITGVIRSYVRPLCTSAQKSRKDASAKDRQQQCSTAVLGFHFRFHQMFPFLFRGAADATPRVACRPPSGTAVSPANLPNMIRTKWSHRSPLPLNRGWRRLALQSASREILRYAFCLATSFCANIGVRYHRSRQ